MNFLAATARGLTYEAYELAAKCGSVTGSYEHGRELLQNPDPDSFSKGVHYLREAAKQGNTDAKILLKVECQNLAGKIHDNSFPTLLNNFDELLFAAFPPGERLSLIETHPDLKKAIPSKLRERIFEENAIAATEGNPDALYECGLMKYEGYGVTRSLAAAVEYWLDAQNREHLLAKESLRKFRDEFIIPFLKSLPQTGAPEASLTMPAGLQCFLMDFALSQKTKNPHLSTTESLTITHNDIMTALDALEVLIGELGSHGEIKPAFKNIQNFAALFAEGLQTYNNDQAKTVAIVTKPPVLVDDVWNVLHTMGLEPGLRLSCGSQLSTYVRLRLKEGVIIPSEKGALTFYIENPYLRKDHYIPVGNSGLTYLRGLGLKKGQIEELRQRKSTLSKILSQINYYESNLIRSHQVKEIQQIQQLFTDEWVQKKINDGLINPRNVLVFPERYRLLINKNFQEMMDSHPKCLCQIETLSSGFISLVAMWFQQVIKPFLGNPAIEKLFNIENHVVKLLKYPGVPEFIAKHPKYLDSCSVYKGTAFNSDYLQKAFFYAFSRKSIQDALISGLLTVEKLRDCPLTFNTVCNYGVLKVLKARPQLLPDVLNLKIPFNNNALAKLDDIKILRELIAGSLTFNLLNEFGVTNPRTTM